MIEEAVSAVLERCIKQNAQTAVQRLKYLSYPTLIGQYIAENASRVISHQNDISY